MIPENQLLISFFIQIQCFGKVITSRLIPRKKNSLSGEVSCVPTYLTQWSCPSWEANTDSDSQEIPSLLWNLKVHYHAHKSSPLVPILCQTNPVHNFSFYFPKIHPIIILPSMPRSSKWSLPFRFSNKKFVCISHPFHVCYMSSPDYPLWLEAYKLWSP